ncbi:MAG: NAD-dependent epimerase/dehydratase family protein [Gemmatimonadota bacterium]|nr:MAG: NAD-dependent epimerase/dehydratase family protein [Gemmatimonadota bacterium]
MTTRRQFLELSAATAGALALSGRRGLFAQQPMASAAKPLRILILGGTGFIGPHQVRYALARGHTVTLFNRGRTNPDMFPEVEKLRGDRDGDLEALKGRDWDAVIDNSATIPRWVRDSAGLLKDSAGQYLYISTLSVYRGFPQPGMDETAPVQELEDPTVEQVNGRTYGGLKALCEQAAQAALPGRTTVVRPGLIVGPGDPTDRWTYWPVRISRGGEVLAPGDPWTLVRYIDARDVSEWCVRMLEDGNTGVYNAVGPRSHLSTAEMLYGIRATTNVEIGFTWVAADFLAEQNVRPWSDLPAWLPPTEEYVGYGSISRDKAIAAGLTFRPLATTALETLDWWRSLPEERRASPRAGLPPEREAEVLAAWHARASG